MIPGPFARADFRGLDDVLAALEQAEDEWGEHFEPPLILRRLVAQGRLGAKSGQGFYPYPQPDAGYEHGAGQARHARRRSRSLWLDNPPANSSRPHVIEGLREGLGARSTAIRRCAALILASPNPALFCAGADIKAFTKMDEAAGRELLDGAHALLRDWEQSRIDDDRGRQRRSRSAAAASWRWPATCASRATRPRSASRRSTSGSSPASAARSGCRGSSARPRRSR